jgi:C_GCAxxG_C_C family probable redox protein
MTENKRNNSSDQAVSCFQEGFSCSQAVLSTFGPRIGLDREMAFRVAGAFGSGMGMGETCGAVTGAFLVIGLMHGKTKADDNKAREKTFALVKEFVAGFKARNRSILCRELLGCDVSTPGGMQAANDKGLFITLCPKFVKDAAEIIDEILMRTL